MKSFREYINLIENSEKPISRLSDEEYNLIAGDMTRRFPNYKLSGLGKNEDGSFNVQMDGRITRDRREYVVRISDDNVLMVYLQNGEPLEEQLDETDADPVRRIEELFRDK